MYGGLAVMSNININEVTVSDLERLQLDRKFGYPTLVAGYASLYQWT
jgi:hypothetical protein